MLSFQKLIVYLPINTRKHFDYYPISNQAIITCHACSALLDRRKKHRLVIKRYTSNIHFKLENRYYFWVCSKPCLELGILKEL